MESQPFPSKKEAKSIKDNSRGDRKQARYARGSIPIDPVPILKPPSFFPAK